MRRNVKFFVDTFFLLFLSLYVSGQLNVGQLKFVIKPREAQFGATVTFSCEVDCEKECLPDCGTKINLVRVHNVIGNQSQTFVNIKPQFRKRLDYGRCIGRSVDFTLTNVTLTDGGFYKCLNSNESQSQVRYLIVFGSLSVFSAKVAIVQRTVTLSINNQQKMFNLTSIEPKQRLSINCSIEISQSYLPHLVTDTTLLYSSEDRITTSSINSLEKRINKNNKNHSNYAIFKWQRDGQLFALNNGLSKNVISDEWQSGFRLHSSLTFTSVQREDVGTYICTAIASENILSHGVVDIYSVPLASIQIIYHINETASSIGSISDSATVRPTAGTNVSLFCDVTANPSARVQWIVSDLNARPDLSKSEDAKLHLGKLKFTQRTFYYCNASNSDGDAMAGVKLMVRDPKAALWPAIGICIELFVIVGLTIFFEIRRSLHSRAHKGCVRQNAAKDSDFPLTAL